MMGDGRCLYARNDRDGDGGGGGSDNDDVDAVDDGDE